MESNWASDHLQTIRTLMERSALYRRALAPIMIVSGSIGLAAAAIPQFTKIESNRGFSLFWLGVSLVALAVSFLLVRRQALKEAESFWSLPTKRVTEALLPAFFVGFAAGAYHVFKDSPATAWLLALGWIIVYGCALHAAGFFMQNRMRGLWLALCPWRLWRAVRIKTVAGAAHHGGGALRDGLLLRRAPSRLRGLSLLHRAAKDVRVNPEPFLQLDRVIHEKGRLAIMSLLAASPQLSFTELRDTLSMTDGNITAHVRTLHESGYIAVTKAFQGGRQITSYSLTSDGRKAFTSYINLLEQIVQQTKLK